MGKYAALLRDVFEKERPGVMLYFANMREQLEEVTLEEAGQVLLAILDYAQFGNVPTFDDRGLRLWWRALVPLIDKDGEKWETAALNTQYATYSRVYKERYEGSTPLDKESWLDMQIRKYETSGDDPLTSGDDLLTERDQQQRTTANSKINLNHTPNNQFAEGNESSSDKGGGGGEERGGNRWEEMQARIAETERQAFDEKKEHALALLNGILP